MMTDAIKDAVDLGKNLQEGFEKGLESSVLVSPKDVIRFNRIQLKRAKINLENAKNRRDNRAVANIQRKIAIYDWTIRVVQYYGLQGEDLSKKIAEAGE